MKMTLPEQIYLQVRDEDGQPLNASRNEVTWCVDQINENDAVYILATLELVALLERLAMDAENVHKHAFGEWAVDDNPRSRCKTGPRPRRPHQGVAGTGGKR